MIRKSISECDGDLLVFTGGIFKHHFDALMPRLF